MTGNSNLNGSPISGFSALLYVNFIIKKKYRVDAVAKEMQVATDTLYRYVRGENIMPPDRIVDLVRATKDVDYLDFFCEPNGYLPTPCPSGQTSKQDRDRLELRLAIMSGQALDEIERAYEDGKLEKLELQRIEKALVRLQEKAAEIREKLRAEVGIGGVVEKGQFLRKRGR